MWLGGTFLLPVAAFLWWPRYVRLRAHETETEKRQGFVLLALPSKPKLYGSNVPGEALVTDYCLFEGVLITGRAGSLCRRRLRRPDLSVSAWYCKQFFLWVHRWS